jgi:hypothetical protein
MSVHWGSATSQPRPVAAGRPNRTVFYQLLGILWRAVLHLFRRPMQVLSRSTLFHRSAYSSNLNCFAIIDIDDFTVANYDV